MGLEIKKGKTAISIYKHKANFITFCASYEDSIGWYSVPINISKKEAISVIKLLQKYTE